MSACPRASCRCLSVALPSGFGCNLSATRNVIRASVARPSAADEFRRTYAIVAGRTRPPGPASSTPGAVVLGYLRDDLERFGLLLVDLGHVLFTDHAVEGQRQHNVKSLFRRHGATSQWIQRAREAPFEIIQNGGKRDARRRERDCDDIILIPVSCAGAVVRHGFAPRASLTVELILFKRAHSSTE